MGGALRLAGCSYGGTTFLLPHGPVAAAQRGYFIEIILILLIVVLPVIVLTPLIAWRYRYRNASSTYRPEWSFSWTLEVLAWGVPVCVVAVLAVWLWRGTHELDPYAPVSADQQALPVEVVGYDWKWLFIYPTLGVASVGQFALPTDRPIAIKLTSDSVMQSFFIPALGSQIYAMAGMVTKLHLKADSAGSYLGENTQYNGKGFQLQRFTALAMAPNDFNTWVERARTTGIALTPDVYDAISAQGSLADLHKSLHAKEMSDSAILFRDVRPDLFANVVASFHETPKSAAALPESAALASSTAAPAEARPAAGQD